MAPPLTLYVIRCTKRPSDNVTWWKPLRAGYTTDLNAAGRYTEEEARKILGTGSCDTAYPLELVERAAKWVVDPAKLRGLPTIILEWSPSSDVKGGA